jgi:chromosome segregation ATPase
MTVSKIATRIQSLLASSPSSNETNGTNDISEKLIRDILTYKLDMAKLKHIYTSCDEEIAAYQELFNDIENQIIGSQNEIKQLDDELNQQQQIRKHREECELLAIQINALPNLNKLEGSIKVINGNLIEVKDAILAIDGKIDQRSKQYDILMQAIADMQNKLNDDDDVLLDTIEEDDYADEDVRIGEDVEDSRIGREREIGIKQKHSTADCDNDVLIEEDV